MYGATFEKFEPPYNFLNIIYLINFYNKLNAFVVHLLRNTVGNDIV